MDGDRNRKYYHLKTIHRRRKNKTTMLKNDSGAWVEDKDELKELVNNFYKNLFEFKFNWSPPEQTKVMFPCMQDSVKHRLGDAIKDEEVKKDIFAVKPWKAPGPDGFLVGFYQKSWSIVRGKVCDFVKQAWNNPGSIAKVNKTDICLIPKVFHPQAVAQFRPISLCNTIYKVVSKVLMERLKECILAWVSPFQTGFVRGRIIHENVIIAKEAMNILPKKKGKKGLFVIKIYLSKAYDKINWDFIAHILKELNLPEKMFDLIMHAISNVETITEVNFLDLQRGIRQGDPLSSYLFLLCMDKLSHLIEQDVMENKWKGIKMGKYGPSISHLMFTDDLLLFGEATESQMRSVMQVLQRFSHLSEQEVSIEKISMMFSNNVPRSIKMKLLQTTGFRETSHFGKYLSVPLSGKKLKRIDY